jgi:serine/threonine-protein kinase
MGAVYVGEHAKSGERVAVKLIAQNVADEEKFRRRFNSEVKSLQRLRHEGIVRLIGYGEEQGQLFYSMELVEGETLQQRIRIAKKLDWRVAVDLAIQITAALKHAHDIGVIHRDLKPANLLLYNDDKIKLVDFGIAKILGAVEQTAEGAVLGTADYMAPEQAYGGKVTQRTDLYALGSVMYAMVTGRPPFTGKSTTDVIRSLERDRPVPLDLVDPDLPMALVELIHNLLEKTPQDRPPTALAVMNRLKAMKAGLEREQTVLSSGMPTESGSDPLSSVSDTDIQQDLNSAVTGGSDRPSAGGSDQSPTVVSGAAGRAALPNDPTLASSARRSARHSAQRSESPSDPPAGETPSTHFRTVDPDDLDRSVHDETTTPLQHWIQVGLMAALFGLLIGAAVWIILGNRAPGVDQTYAMVLRDGDVGTMEGFLRRFPDDPRAAEVESLLMQARLTRTIRRLETQSKLGVTPLDATERSFLDAMKLRSVDPRTAGENLGLWLDIHDVSTRPPDDAYQPLIELARYERARLAEQPRRLVVDPKAEELIREIRERVSDSPADEARKMLEGILSLHADDAWAKPALEEAQKQLDALDEDSDNGSPPGQASPDPARS